MLDSNNHSGRCRHDLWHLRTTHVMRALEGMTGVMDVQVNLRDQRVSVEHLADWIEVSSHCGAAQCGLRGQTGRTGHLYWWKCRTSYRLRRRRRSPFCLRITAHS